MKKGVGLSLLCTMLTGCAAVTGFPQPIMSERQENIEIAGYVSAFAISDYDKCPDKVVCRNTIVDARLRAVDLAFYRFQRKIYSQDSRVALGSNVLTLALDSVATVTSVGGLAAGAGLLTGGRDVFQKQIRSVSLPLLFEEMTAKRREVLLRIRLGQRLSASAYTLFQALDDVSEYETAGSIPAAAAELGASAGQSSRTAQIQLDALRASSLAAAGVVGAMPPPDAASTAAQSSSGTVVYSSNSGTASVATVVQSATSKTPPSPGSVIYTNQTGPGTVTSVIPVPPPVPSPTQPAKSAPPTPIASPTGPQPLPLAPLPLPPPLPPPPSTPSTPS